jgi:hypothetical protein
MSPGGALTATYVPGDNRLIVTWRRNKLENKIKHEFRYAFTDIHRTGWDAAKSAPQGLLTPPGDGGYNGMVYDSTALPLRGQKLVYVAIKPENATVFSQIAIPLTLDKAVDP